MRVTVTVPPAVEPIDLAAAKAYLRQDADADDALISALIAAARRYCEHWLGKAFITQTIEQADSGFPGGNPAGSMLNMLRAEGGYAGAYGGDWLPQAAFRPLRLMRPPLQSIAGVYYVDQAGAEILMDPSAYQVRRSEPAELAPAPQSTWPATRPGQLESVRAVYTAGYGDDPADVPETIRTAILLWVAYLYENRGEQSAEPPAAVLALLSIEDYGRYG